MLQFDWEEKQMPFEKKESSILRHPEWGGFVAWLDTRGGAGDLTFNEITPIFHAYLKGIELYQNMVHELRISEICPLNGSAENERFPQTC